MFHIMVMETITIRELRQNWPGIERRLKVARGPLLVTRDGTPVAQLSPAPAESASTQPGFSAAAHRLWRAKHWSRSLPKTDSSRWLARTREDHQTAVDS